MTDERKDTCTSADHRNELEEVKHFLRSEIRKEERRKALTLWGGSLFALALFTYMWKGIAVPFDEQVLNARNGASFIARSVDAEIPGMIEKLEVEAKSYARPLARQSSENMSVLIPAISDAGKKHVDQLEFTLVKLEEVADMVIDVYFEEHGDDIKAFVDANGGEKFLETFLTESMDQFIEDIEVSMAMAYDGTDIEALNKDSVDFLHNLSHEMKRLGTKDRFDMTHGERLQRRLIVAWMQMLQQQFEIHLSSVDE